MPVFDENTAYDAAKMGGFPLAIMGLHFALLAWLLSDFDSYESSHSSVLYAASLFFFVVSFRIRSGNFLLLPLFVTLCLIILILHVTALFLGSISQFGLLGGTAVFIALGILPFIFLTLSISGMRGWFWLRKNGYKMRW